MFERAEVAYRETQYGIEIKGKVQPIAVGPNEAERYRAAGVPVFRREKTTYHPDTTEWRPLPDPELRCGGTNANVCVAEGCYGEACRSGDALAGMEAHAATADTDERGRA